MNHEANNANSKASHSRSCSGFFVHAIHSSGTDSMTAFEWVVAILFAAAIFRFM